MCAVYKRELKSYFSSMLGYALIGVFLLFLGIFFVGNNLKSGSASVGGTLYNISTIFVIILPLLTMRLFAEEQRAKTDQLLFSSPVSIWSIIFGKYFAVVTVFSIPVLVALTMPLVIGKFAVGGDYPYLQNYTAILAFWLMGSVMLALGMMISAMTESQVVAGLVSIAVNFLIWLMSSIASIIPASAITSLIGIAMLLTVVCLFLFLFIKNIVVTGVVFLICQGTAIALYMINSTWYEALISTVLNSVSFFQRMSAFVSGTFSYASIVYYLSFIFLFLYLTMQVIQKRRWS